MTNDTPTKDHIGAIPIAGDYAKKPASALATLTPRQQTSSGRPVRPKEPIRPRRWGRWLAVTLTLGLLLYTLAGYVLVPYLFHSVLPELASRQTGRSIAIGGASFNPFTLTLTLRNAIVGPDQKGPADQPDPLLSCGWIEADLQVISLFNLQFNARRLHFNDLFLHVQRYADNTINLASLLPAPAPGTTERYSFAAIPLPFSLANITIANSRILFDDSKTGKTYTIEQMRLALPYLANRRGDRGLLSRLAQRLTSGSISETQFIRPEFSATMDGSPVQLTGETKLTDDGTETSLSITLQALNLADFWSVLPVAGNLIMDKGSADLDLQLIFTTSRDTPPTLRLQGTAQLHDLWLRNQQGQEVAEVAHASLTGKISPMTGEYHFTELLLDQPVVHVERDPAGNWSLAQDKKARPAAEPLVFEVERFKVVDGRLSLVDRQVTGGFAMTWSEIQCTAESLSTTHNKTGKLALTARTGERGGLSLQGDLALFPMRATGMLVFKDFDLPSLSPYLARTDGFALKGGRLESLEAGFSLQPAQGNSASLSFTDASLQGRGLALDRQGRTILELPEFAITKGALLISEKQLDFGELRAKRARLLLEWSGDGTLAWGLPLLDEDSGWQTNLSSLNVQEAQIMLRRPDPDTPFDLDLTAVQITATDLGKPAVPGTVTATAQLQDGGAINLNGPLTLHPWSATLACRLDNLPLSLLLPLFSDWLVPDITDGQLMAEGTLTLPGRNFSGAATVHDLAATLNNTEILSWRQATANDCQLTLSPFALHIQDLAIATPFLTWSVDGESPPLRRFFKQGKALAAEALRIDHLSILDGTLGYHDRTAMPPFSLLVTALTGTVDNLVSLPDKRANISLQGKIAEASGLGEKSKRSTDEDMGTLEVTGLASLFDPSPFFDLRIHAIGVSLPPLAPYMESDLGYQVRRGSLEMTSTLHLEHESMTADNSLAITGFLVGNPVASPTRLPITLALLTDKNGVITTDIPVAGDMDDPAFSIRRSLMNGIRNLLIRTTASPFALLGSSFPNQVIPDHVPFAFGSSVLTQEYQKNLQNLADILRQRPRLRLTIKGFADARGDQEALLAAQKTEQLKRRLAQEALQAEQLPATYGKEEIQPLRVLTKTEDRGIAAEESSVVVGDKELAILARQRAAEVQRFFRETTGLEEERFREADDIGLVPMGGLGRSGNRVQFSLDSMTP